MQRLSGEEYKNLAQEIKLMQEIYWDVFRAVRGRYPKNSKIMKKLLALDGALYELYYQMEQEFFKDYPDKELRDYGKR